MKIINLTPHRISILLAHDGSLSPKEGRLPLYHVEPSGDVARVETAPSTDAQSVYLADESEIAVRSHSSLSAPDAKVAGLPEPKSGAIYLVSLPCLDAAARAGRSDVYAPDTGPGSVERDAAGQISFVRRLIQACPQ